ncbi:MAG: hypothetical protein JRG82_17235 [Deltaproteobacteria bacterium]|nr:hypothetical protein [Deltaproteobacteria bacterium]
MEASAARPGSADRLRAARRVAWPYFLHFVGFQPARDFDKAIYPRIMGYPFRETPDAQGAHGLDFSQVWIASRRLAAGEDVYERIPDKGYKKWRRRWTTTYHPVIHWLYLPLSWLPLRDGLIVHNLFSSGLFLLCAALALARAGCLAALPGLASAFAVAMLLTPSGLLHLERGQFDLYVASALVCVVTLFASERPARFARDSGWGLGAGLLSTLKVSAWPLVGFYWMLGAGLRGLRSAAVWLVPGTIVVLNVLFFQGVLDWLPAFLYVAGDRAGMGASFALLAPGWLAAALPFVSAVIVAGACFVSLRMRGELGDDGARRELLARISFPVAAALAVQTICGTPVTHDYRLVALFGLMPLMSVWCVQGETVPDWLRHAAAFGYALMLVMAMRIIPFTSLSAAGLATCLLFGSLLWLGLAVYLAFGGSRSRSSST